jgi:hypothetical protein
MTKEILIVIVSIFLVGLIWLALRARWRSCGCTQAFSGTDAELPSNFASVRSRCQALRSVLVPDEIWDEFQSLDAALPDDRHHRSIMLLAYQRGYLARLTTPVHRLILDGDHVSSRVNEGYLGNYIEAWKRKTKPRDRHGYSRGYQGILHELVFAEHLRQDGWSITDFAAWQGAKHDVEAERPGGGATAFEIKFIGEDNESFESNGGFFSLEKPSDYLISRLYEAANQLQRADRSKRRIAVIIIGLMTRGPFEIAFKMNKINLNSPSFYHTGEESWTKHFKKLLKDYPDIESDLTDCIGSIDEAWILYEAEGFTYEIASRVTMRSAC